MPRYAEIGPNQEVLRVIVADDISWPQSRLGGIWVETVKDDVTQKYAGIGDYDSENVAPARFVYPWQQPTGAQDAYPNAAWVWHNGRAWRSLQAANVFEPGVASWREMLVEWPEWVQPTGAQDAYQIGEKITWNGERYISLIDANVWNPDTYPAGWELQ